MQSSGSSRESLNIVGGAYLERCQMPDWSQFFGSGLRAAAAVSGGAAKITLHTYVSDAQRALLDSISATFQIEVAGFKSPGVFEFDYRHPLAPPVETLTDKGVYELPPLEVTGERILVFGMLEGVPIIQGKHVVYDPQSPLDPVPFHQNGSEAKHLAVVANWSEAQRLSGENDIESAGKKMLATCDVVVIKRGPLGAYVFTENQIETVPAYKTRHVFPIGSGDVFSAMFAYAWIVEQKDPREAANFASLATALYCQTTILPIPRPLPRDFHPPEVQKVKTPLIYLAGPFFSLAQLWMVEETRTILANHGAKVFSPYHDVGLGTSSVVAEKDVEALKNCDSVFALLDGYDPGTIFEVGYARAIGKPVTAFGASAEAIHLTMFIGTGCEIFHDFASSVYNAVWR
jgi:nucleoside 2-deoxyribosyltransferase